MSFINKKSLAILLASVMACAAYATPPGNNGGGNGGCGVGQQTNGCGGTTNNNPSANATAAAVAVQGQLQGQGQQQSVRNNVRNENRVSNENRVRNNNNVTVNVSTPKQEPQLQTVKDPYAKEPAPAAPSAVEQQVSFPEIPVSSATAPGLTSANGTCMGSSSGGMQFQNFGFSGGTTWTDSGCDTRYDAQALEALGQRAAAIARLCMKTEIRQAMEAANPAACKSAKIGSSDRAPVAVVGSSAPAGSSDNLNLLP